MSFLNMVPIVVYSHSDYSDLWVPFFNRLEKYFKNCKIYFFTNENEIVLNNNLNIEKVFYNDDVLYSDRLNSCLNKIDEEFILFLHEDMILYDYVNIDNVIDCLEFLRNNTQYNFVRLIKSGIKTNTKIFDFLYKIETEDFQFSITPTIWRTETLLNVCKKFNNSTIWDLELNGDTYFRETKIQGLYTFKNENIRGGHHDSKVFPHMCSAIFKGRWNLEYKKELDDLFEEYNINKDDRGTIF